MHYNINQRSYSSLINTRCSNFIAKHITRDKQGCFIMISRVKENLTTLNVYAPKKSFENHKVKPDSITREIGLLTAPVKNANTPHSVMDRPSRHNVHTYMFNTFLTSKVSSPLKPYWWNLCLHCLVSLYEHRPLKTTNKAPRCWCHDWLGLPPEKAAAALSRKFEGYFLTVH